MENNHYKNWSEVKYLEDIITNPLIRVGKKSYYSGFYENSNFENGCVRYLWGDETTRDLFHPEKDFGWELDKLIIGNYVCIASGVTILLGGNHNHHPDWLTVYPFEEGIKDSFEKRGDTVINSDAWIGMGATIMPGVTIGEGAIVATGSMVVKDVQPYTIVGGNPAKVIKKRFDEATIGKLLEIRWFDWKESEVKPVIPLLLSNQIDQLYTYYQDNIK
ncbi:CatB-related O-acetyltransferase [Vagococcus hydrophili]|uniref:CatB-related O-acetyltransferase n=1 Tax=Vagococcus hydrophili TaxID=2714947 RepID=A0A6G8ARL1_9ENTE|nr:CatB-related O-acetyltransferase [Vagococcus hydrophili]QIL47711.1 CatB-related O-acetyltransferase [Vagococcus hydrophili]